MENLSFFFEQAQAHGILPVAVTVPSLQEDCWLNEGCKEGQSQSGLSPAVEQAIVQRVMLNQSIKDFGARKALSCCGLVCRDLRTQNASIGFSIFQ